MQLLWCFHSAGHPPSRASVAIPSRKAQEFLARLSRTKRNIWDRSRPDVQQWIQQFTYLGFDEQVGEIWTRRCGTSVRNRKSVAVRTSAASEIVASAASCVQTSLFGRDV